MSARVSEEEKLRKARIRSHRWYHAHKHEIRETVRARTRRYHLINREKIRERARIRMSTPQAKKKRSEQQKIWRRNNPGKLRIYEQRQKNKIQRVIKNRLCNRLRGVLNRRNIDKTSRTIDLIGCSWRLLAIHIGNQFVGGMSWGNRHLWHIDHIRPCASFDLTDPEQQKACFHYTNLQPLWCSENMTKHAKWESK